MDHDLVIGPGASAHVNVEQLAAPIVLYIRNGQLFARTRQAAGAGADAGEPITLGAQHNIGGVSFVVTSTSSDR